MKKIVFVLMLFVGLGAKSQSLTEKMGAGSTEFKITSAWLELNVTNQILIMQNTTSYNSSRKDRDIRERYYLQFICTDKLATTSRAKIKKDAIDKRLLSFYPNGYFVKLVDDNNNVVYEFTIERGGSFDGSYNLGKNGYYMHSFYLDGFPLILLDRVKQVDVQIIN